MEPRSSDRGEGGNGLNTHESSPTFQWSRDPLIAESRVWTRGSTSLSAVSMEPRSSDRGEEDRKVFGLMLVGFQWSRDPLIAERIRCMTAAASWPTRFNGAAIL